MKQEYFEVILEEIKSKLGFLLDGLAFMKPKVAKIDKVETDIESIRADLNIIRPVITDHSKGIRALKTIHPDMRHAD